MRHVVFDILTKVGTRYWQTEFVNPSGKEANWQPLIQGLACQNFFQNPPLKLEVSGEEIPDQRLDPQYLAVGFLHSCLIEG